MIGGTVNAYEVLSTLKAVSENRWNTSRIDGNPKNYNYGIAEKSPSLGKGHWRTQVVLKLKPSEEAEKLIKADAVKSKVPLTKTDSGHWEASTWFYIGTEDAKPEKGGISEKEIMGMVGMLKASEVQGLFFKIYGKYASGGYVNTVKKR